MRYLRFLCPLAYMLAIYGLSSIPDTGAPETALQTAFQWVSPTLQNLLHIPLYAGLCYVWFWALSGMNHSVLERCFGAIAVTVVFGVFDEWHQMIVPGRYGSLTDMMLNSLGAAFLPLCLWLHKTWRIS